MRNFLSHLQRHHQVEVEKSNAKILIMYVRSTDGTMGIDYFDTYEEITKEELEYYIYECNEIRVMERE